MLMPIAMDIDPGLIVKPQVNVGGLCDIPAGSIEKGIHGESIINGGLAQFEGVAGRGNVGKSTFTHNHILTACYRMGEGAATSVYDTEINIQESRLMDLIAKTTYNEVDPHEWAYTGKWLYTDKNKYMGEEWFDIFKKYCTMKRKEKRVLVKTPFLDRKKDKGEPDKPLEIPQPTMAIIDSISMFEVSATVAQLDKAVIGDSKGNTVEMNLGRHRSRLINEASRLAASSCTYMMTVTHLGKEMMQDQYAPPKRILPGMPFGEVFKGAPPKYEYLTSNLWYLASSSVLSNKNDKGAEYPKYKEDRMPGCTDLNIVTVNLVRAKNGMSNTIIHIIISQKEGVLPTLSELHYLRNSGWFGFNVNGNQSHFSCQLYPSLTMQRTTVRNEIDTNPILRRAINICSEMKQMQDIWTTKGYEHYYCTPQELYDDLIKLGYDWDILLNTRGWWTVEGQFQGLNFLSSMDLMRMRVGEYHPYWLEDDKKTIKKAYRPKD